MKTLKTNISVLPYNTFHLDGKAREVIEYDSIDDLREVILSHQGQRMLAVGEGSNLLFTKDFEGTLLVSRMTKARALKETATEVWIEAQSGLKLDSLIEQLVAMDLTGMENLSYIPGTVGASAVQNVGAYGREAKDVIEEVHTLSVATAEPRVFTNAECRFGYRDSVFKNELKDQYIVTSVVYKLQKNGPLYLDYGNLRAALEGVEPTAATVREAVIRIRKQKLPEVAELGSAGSFFKNPVIDNAHFEALQQQYPTIPHYIVNNPSGEAGLSAQRSFSASGPSAEGAHKIPAAWLIEQCGWKGKCIGGAQCYEKQPLVLVNTGTATAQDIIALAQAIVDSVQERFCITIHPEVNYI